MFRDDDGAGSWRRQENPRESRQRPYTPVDRSKGNLKKPVLRALGNAEGEGGADGRYTSEKLEYSNDIRVPNGHPRGLLIRRRDPSYTVIIKEAKQTLVIRSSSLPNFAHRPVPRLSINRDKQHATRCMRELEDPGKSHLRFPLAILVYERIRNAETFVL